MTELVVDRDIVTRMSFRKDSFVKADTIKCSDINVT